MFLIAGLGNPGKNYQLNRHNVGFIFIDLLKEKYSLNNFSKKSKYFYLKDNIFNESIILIKPVTYMNLSGLAVQSALAFFKIPVENIIIIYDDVALPFGMLRVRERGSCGGHNGLKSIEQQLGQQDYMRIRIGIGAPQYGSQLKDYVLNDFSAAEFKFLKDELFKKVEDIITLIIKDSINEAMNKYNAKINPEI